MQSLGLEIDCSRKYSEKSLPFFSNVVKKHFNQIEKLEIQKRGLFCYPDIISIIYQYHTVSEYDIDIKRHDLLRNATQEYSDVRILIQITQPIWEPRLCPQTLTMIMHPPITDLNKFSLLLNEQINYTILIRDDFNEMNKTELKMWLKTMGYSGFESLQQKQLRNLVIKYNNEINDSI